MPDIITRALAPALAAALLLTACGKSEPAAEAPAAKPAAEAPVVKPVAEAPAAKPAASAFDAAMADVLRPYLTIQDALARDTTDGVADAARALGAAAARLDPASVTGEHAGHYAEVPKKLTEAAAALAAAGDLAAARAAFKDLSKPMSMWATMARPAGLDVVYCSMAPGGWVQTTGDIRNPYYGDEMLDCGEVVSGPGRAAQ